MSRLDPPHRKPTPSQPWWRGEEPDLYPEPAPDAPAPAPAPDAPAPKHTKAVDPPSGPSETVPPGVQ